MIDLIQNSLHYFWNLWDIWYLILFLSTIFESLILFWNFFPWSSITIAFWAMWAMWFYDIWDVFFFAILWNIVWNMVSYFIWKKVWKKVFKEWFYFIKAEHFQKASKFFNNHWWKSVFLWKLIPWIKENIPFIAWILEINFFKYFLWNFLWTIIWSLLFVWVWYIFSSSLNLAEIWVWRFWYFIGIFLLIILIITLLRIYLKKF